MDYFEKLKDEMSYQGITQKELSEKTGISINTIRGWFSKRVYPDLFSAYKIAQVLNQPVEYFINDDIFPPNNFHLPSREISLLEDFRKLDNHDKVLVECLISAMIKESHTTSYQIDKNSIGLVADFNDKK